MKPRRNPPPAARFNEETIDPIHLGASIARLPNDHALVVAARSALEIKDARVATREAALDVAAAYKEAAERTQLGGAEVVQPGVGREGHGLAGEWGVPHEVIAARRAQPGPLAGKFKVIPKPREPADDKEGLHARADAAIARAREACQAEAQTADWSDDAAEDRDVRVRT